MRSSNPECRLPALPGPLPNPIGFPAPDGQSIYVSKSDWAQLAARDIAIRDWMTAAQSCLEVLQR